MNSELTPEMLVRQLVEPRSFRIAVVAERIELNRFFRYFPGGNAEVRLQVHRMKLGRSLVTGLPADIAKKHLKIMVLDRVILIGTVSWHLEEVAWTAAGGTPGDVYRIGADADSGDIRLWYR